MGAGRGPVTVAASPEELLLRGVEILNPSMAAHGFVFGFGASGKGSGGLAAWGEFVRGARRLELNFRYSLGLVCYRFEER